MLPLRMTPRLHGWGGAKPPGRASVGEDRRHHAPWDPTMDTQPERLRFGPYRLLRDLDSGPVADRLLALHERRHTSHVVYRFGVQHDAAERRRFLNAVEPLTHLDHPHLLPVEEYSFAGDGRAWLVTPYTGSQVGLMTLSRLLADKGGRMAPSETQRALTHTLDAVHAAHHAGLIHGPLSSDDILIDRRGSATVELYGLSLRLRPDSVPTADHAADLRRQELRSVVAMGYRLLTGLSPASPHGSACRLIKRLDRRWDQFFAEGLAPDSFPSAAAAMAALPGTLSKAPALATPRQTRPVAPTVTLRPTSTDAPAR